MSQLALQRSETPSDSQLHESSLSPTQESPTLGRALQQPFSFTDTTTTPSGTTKITKATTSASPSQLHSASITSPRSRRKPAPSPLQSSIVLSPPSSATSSTFEGVDRFDSLDNDGPHALTTNVPAPKQPLLPSLFAQDEEARSISQERSFLIEDPSPPATPVSKLPEFRTPGVSSNDSRSGPDPVRDSRPPVGRGAATPSTMAGGNSRVEAQDAVRKSSVDSALSGMEPKMPAPGAQDASASPADVAKLIKAAGSPEAVIQYLLKEKQAQSQQNSQLWRLVDKQRAMILGLNKDLERALKDKEKYRKKLKEVMAVHENGPVPDAQHHSAAVPRVDVEAPREHDSDTPASPSIVDSDSVKHSPIDMSLAPYPITPPADQVSPHPASAVGELIDPSAAMPVASDHAFDNYDHEEAERVAVVSKSNRMSMINGPIDMPYGLSLPPSRSLPSEPPRMPPPKPPVPTISEPAMTTEQVISQFPPPSAPPPRKPPPAPLQLKKVAKAPAAVVPEDENDSDSDYDSLLEANGLPLTERRGRRRTREEDDKDREVIAIKEAEIRSQSKKSKKESETGTPKLKPADEPQQAQAPAPPTVVVPPPTLALPSLEGVMNGGTEKRTTLALPPMAAGLPASPRPMSFNAMSLGSPPLSPRGLPQGALSPRAPRQPIPLPGGLLSPGFPLEPMNLTSPKPLNITKKSATAGPADSAHDREIPAGRTTVYKEFVSDEYPGLLLPPNALTAIQVKVASSRMKPSRASLMSLTQLEEDPVITLAILSRSERGELWRVEKDSASLAKLDQRMKQCSAFTAKTPERGLFSGHAPAKLDARRIALDHYLGELLETPLDHGTAIELCKYLSSNVVPPNADDTGSSMEASSDAISQKTGPGGRPFKSGYLTKRGKNFGGWKARFFVLDGPLLKYYETPGGAHLGTIKLPHAQIGKQSQHNTEESSTKEGGNDEVDNQYRHAFLVMEPKKKDSSSHVRHVLCAESDKERDQWVETLLKWIDFRDPEEEEAKAAQERRGSNSSNQVSSSKAKSKPHGQGKSAHAQSAQNGNQDELIGVSYNSAKQGDIPDGVPTRRGTGNLEPSQERTATPTLAISAPRDPQLISDTSNNWGAKTTLGVPGPTHDEKKQRKRSFFGFGPKTRGSTDDQDSIYSSKDSQSVHSEHRGPVRQVFGASLGEAVRYCGPVDVNVPLPSVVYRCIQYLEAKNAINEEGIFRLSGSNVVIKQLRERFNTEGDVNLLTDETYYDIHAVASLLKLYLRELPTTILTRDLHLQFLAVTEMSRQPEKLAALGELVTRLPQANATLLKYLIAFLIRIINNAEFNKMTVRNVGIVFSPTLNIPAPVFALFLQNYEPVFGIDPEEYELPSPVSDDDSRPPSQPQGRRPSATGSTESPHRHRLVDQQRSTPTPPLVMMNQGYMSATPPQMNGSHSRQANYEPQYMSQQQPHGSRPAYESSFGMPANYDPHGMHGRGQPAYDRPHYGSNMEQEPGDLSAPYETHASKAKRRESTMFMGNLNHQGSKSRLREETRLS